MRPENQFAYAAEMVRCHACAAAQRETRGYAKTEGSDTAGIMARFTRHPNISEE